MPAQRKYPPELIERAVRMVSEKQRETPGRPGIIREVGDLLGIHPEALRHWVKKHNAQADPQAVAAREEPERIRQMEKENAELRRANEILKAAAAFFRSGTRPPTTALIRFIDTHHDRFGVTPICHTLAIAVSTYYAAKHRPPAARSVRDAELTTEIRRIHQANYGVYGARKVWHQLRREGIPVARSTVERLMRAEGLAGAVRGRKIRTTVPGKDGRRAGDLVNRDFAAAGPDRLWVADFTYVPCWAGTVYVASCIDAFSRRILGWKASTSRRTSLVLDVVEQALWQRGYRTKDQVTGLVHHSDAGSQYTSIAFTERLAQAGIAPSVGRVADAYDNALAESTIGLFKTELINRRRPPWKTFTDVEFATAEWIDWYNHRRLHGALGHISPAECETAYHHQHTRANDPVSA